MVRDLPVSTSLDRGRMDILLYRHFAWLNRCSRPEAVLRARFRKCLKLGVKLPFPTGTCSPARNAAFTFPQVCVDRPPRAKSRRWQLAGRRRKKTAPPFRLKLPQADTLRFALPIDYNAEPVIGPAPMATAQDKFLAERVRNATRNAVGFPNPFNKQFRDLSPVVEGDPALFSAVVQAMAGLCEETAPDCIMCVESWGYIFGAPVAYLLGCRMKPVLFIRSATPAPLTRFFGVIFCRHDASGRGVPAPARARGIHGAVPSLFAKQARSHEADFPAEKPG
jgi:hypothetical protein